jgi:hypothetical protein
MPMSLELIHIQQAFARQEIVAPFVQVFDQSALKFKQNLTITESLDVMFPEQKRQDKDLLKAKEALGELAKEFTEVELKEVITDVDFIVESWLDDFERELFKGKTMQELLHEKGGI